MSLLICAKCGSPMSLHNTGFDVVSDELDRYECGYCGMIIKVSKSSFKGAQAKLTLVPPK